MQTQSMSNRTVQAAFGSAIAVLLVVGAISYRGIAVSGAADIWVRHSQEVIENLQNLRLEMQRVQSSSLGFVLTGDENAQRNNQDAARRAEQIETNLRNLTVDNPTQQRSITTVVRLADQRIQSAQSVINLRLSKGEEAAADSVRAADGERIMGEFKEAVQQMEQEEQRLLALRDADAKRHVTQTKVVLILGTVLGLLVAAGAGLAVQRDHSARESAEEALREGEERFRNLANNMPQLAWMADEKGSIFWYNDRWFEYTGSTLKEMSGWGWRKALHPDHAQRVVDKITHCFQTGQDWEDTFPLRGKDRTYRLFLSKAVPIRNPQGKVLRWFGTNTDISESKESGAKYRGLLEAAPDAMVVVNQSGEIVLLNVQAEKQFGYHRDELVGQPVKNIIPRGFAERLVADGTRSAAEALAQQIGTGIELIARRKDGSEFPIELMLSPLANPEGILVTAAIRDISVRKVADGNLARKVEELSRSNEELGQFAYIASHDLQEPLRMVASYTQLLSRRYKGKLDSDADEFIAFAVDGANRMQRLIQDLLIYSRVGTKENKLADISSEHALQQALGNLRSVIEESHAVVTHDPLPV